MPILSYLAIPRNGKKEQLLQQLNSLEYCEAHPAENVEVLVLVTDTPDKGAEKKLQKQLVKLESLETLSMTFGYNDELQHNDEGEDHEDR